LEHLFVRGFTGKTVIDKVSAIDSHIPKIVSGGQTDADRAALDWALARGIECGDWCPKGRKAEDGRIAKRYPLIETASANYVQRTEWNVRGHRRNGHFLARPGSDRRLRKTWLKR